MGQDLLDHLPLEVAAMILSPPPRFGPCCMSMSNRRLGDRARLNNGLALNWSAASAHAMGVAELTELRVYCGAGVNDDLKQFQADLLGATNWRRSGVSSGASGRSWVATKPRHA